MTAAQIIQYLKETYPGKNIVKIPEDDPSEIICELGSTTNVAIAAIKTSTPHYHKLATEIYEVLQGKLELTVDGKVIPLQEGETYTIQPNQVHAAKGNFTLVKVTSQPGWTPEDHIIVEAI